MSSIDTPLNFEIYIEEAFYDYLSLDLPVIPLCSYNHQKMSLAHQDKCKSPGKAPLIKNWTNHTQTTEQHIQSWLKQFPTCNIGLPLGNNSNIVGIDIDGDYGELILEELSKGEIPKTWEFTTGKGRRLLYSIPEGIHTKKYQDLEHRGEEFALLVTGQQTVLPPSIHHTGRPYQWKSGCSPFECALAPAPDWLIEKVMISDAQSYDKLIAPEITLAPIEDLSPYLPQGDGSLSELFPNGFPKLNLNISSSVHLTGKKLESPKVTEADWTKDVGIGNRNNHLTKLAGSLLHRKQIPKDEVLTFLKAWNIQHCKPPLEENEIERMVEKINANEEMKLSKNIGSMGAQEKKPFRPTPFVKHFLKQQQQLGFQWKYAVDQGAFYRCDVVQGPWKRIENIFVQKAIGEIMLDPSLGGDPRWDTQHYINEAVNALSRALATHTEGSLFDLGINAYKMKDFVSVNNGLLYWRTGELVPWDPEILTTIQLPVDWIADAQCPVWEQVLSEWIPDENTRKFLQEFIGICLIPDSSFRTAVFLYGSGANGKSLFIDAVRMLFGDALISIPLHRLAERFEVANLQNKLINVCGDIDSKYLSETGVLKSIIGGDALRGEFKHGKSFDFIPVCRLMFSANTLPKAGDKSLGWYSRWQFVQFPKTFEVDSRYKIELLAKLEEERSGILKWAVEGLKRVKAENRFTISLDMEHSKMEYRTENDNVLAFFEEVVDIVDHEGINTVASTAALHGIYREWCEVNGMKATNQIGFTKRITQFGIPKSRRTINGKSCAVFLGIKPKPAYQQEYEYYANTRVNLRA